MKPKGLLAALVLLAGLGGAIWWSNKKQASTPAAAVAKVLSLPADQVQEVRIEKAGAKPLVLRREGPKWRMVDPALPADQDAAGSMVAALSDVSVDQTIEEKAVDLAPYGLNTPALSVAVVRKDGKTQNLLIGDETPTGSGNYAKLADNPRVYTVATSVKSSVNKTADDLRDKRLLTFDSDKLTRVSLQAKGPTLEFGKNNQNEWQILTPRPLRADGSKVDDLVTRLRDAKMELPGPDTGSRDAAAEFAAGIKVATAAVTDAGGAQSIEVRKNKEDYYAHSTAVAGTYKVAADLGTALDKSLDDFRNKKLFDFGFSDPNRLEIRNGGGAPVTYAKAGDKWSAAAKQMDNAGVQNLIDKLRDLTSTKFPENAGGEPVFEAAVTSNDGKRLEKVTVTQQANQFFAKREGEPAIYELEAQTVADLRKAASEIKEAPAPQQKKK